ncbi:putative ATPase [Heterostelium album PN500]|uniref:Putative ATPase n=1 Tax=Heterostelium pallidum (strain ATCC 26659 / Pp 5 / PN500) TaxID=670386 RepID=D3B9F1_HETP5|nr:putative ATPase [Heterostelium album PN500]EFA81863.1 putative ATPase [Heterostelium album PN500]|eukprot:XP_020433980.1 putative ATPase [Heterostelium album PN500]
MLRNLNKTLFLQRNLVIRSSQPSSSSSTISRHLSCSSNNNDNNSFINKYSENSKRTYTTSTTTTTTPTTSEITSETIHKSIKDDHIVKEGPLAKYDQMIKDNKIRVDKHQRETVKLLQNLFDQIKNYNPMPSNESDNGNLSKWFSMLTSTKPTIDPHKNEIKGVYLYGDVGCGKSFLMDLFYDSVPINKKKRIHFHHFMLDVHKRIHKWRQNKSENENDPIPPLSKELTSEAWLLCFDEFQVTDVSDAMILKRLFSCMFDNGAILVTTSNRQPNDLYKNGLNRQLFVPFIHFLESKCLVYNLNSGLDYRLSGTRTKKVFLRVDTWRTGGELRVTEQGEMISAHYRQPGMAVRTIEVYTTATLKQTTILLQSSPLNNRIFYRMSRKFK